MLEFALGTALGAFFSWLFTHLYYKKSSADLRRDLGAATERLKPRNTLENFELLLEEGQWKEVQIDDKSVWVCQSDNTYQIHLGDCSERYAERWTTVYPDRSGRACPVYLKIGNAIIKELTFVYMDGFRIFVPMTEVRPVPGSPNNPEFFWNKGSLAVKVCQIIGKYYLYKSLEGVAEMSDVTIVA